MTASKRRRFTRGVTALKSMLRHMPDAVSAEMVDIFESSGQTLLSAMKGKTPHRTGKLQAGLSYKVFPTTLRLEVGLRKTKAGRSDLFYGRILDLGFRPQIPVVQRWHHRAKRKTVPYPLRMPGMEARRFVTGRYQDERSELRSRLQGIFARARAKLPAGDDPL